MSQTIPNNILWNPPQAQHEVNGGWATFSAHWTSKERVLDSYLSGGGSEQKLFSLSLGFVRGEGGEEGLLQKWGKGGWERIKSFSSFLFPFLVSCSECSFGCTCPRTCLDILLSPRTLSFRDACGNIRGRSKGGGERGKTKIFSLFYFFTQWFGSWRVYFKKHRKIMLPPPAHLFPCMLSLNSFIVKFAKVFECTSHFSSWKRNSS